MSDIGFVVDVSLREMLTAMAHLPDETVFRWYQRHHQGPNGAVGDEAMRITLGQLRRELGIA